MDQSYCHAPSLGRTCSFLDDGAAAPGPPTLWEAEGHHLAKPKPAGKQSLTPGLKIVTTRDDRKTKNFKPSRWLHSPSAALSTTSEKSFSTYHLEREFLTWGPNSTKSRATFRAQVCAGTSWGWDLG